MILVFHMMNAGAEKDANDYMERDITSQFNIKNSLYVEYETVNCLLQRY